MADVATALDGALRAAGLLIDGVSIGRKDDKTTWRVDFRGDPTEVQKSAAAAVIAAFDPAAVADAPSEIDQLKARLAVLESTTATLITDVAAVKAAPAVAKGAP